MYTTRYTICYSWNACQARNVTSILSSPLTLYLYNLNYMCVTLALGLYIGTYNHTIYTCRIYDFCKHETLTRCFAKCVDCGLTLAQHWVDVSCLPGRLITGISQRESSLLFLILYTDSYFILLCWLYIIYCSGDFSYCMSGSYEIY